jgi:hypothetical protein
MKNLRWLFLISLLVLAGCGVESTGCNGVDTSGAPTSVQNTGSTTVYRWNDCSRYYPNN